MPFQSQVYECSAANASVKISNNDWINEFSDGITLELGETVRVLGSFIQERGGGDTIEVPKDISFNLAFNPYVIAETIISSPHTGTGRQLPIDGMVTACSIYK